MNLLEFSHQFNQMLNSFLLIFAFSGEGHYGASGQAQSLQFEQAFGAGAFAVGGYSDLRSEAFSFFNKLSSRAVCRPFGAVMVTSCWNIIFPQLIGLVLWT